MVTSVLFFQVCEPFDCDTYHLAEVLVNLGNLCLNLLNQFVSLILIELQNALHLDFQKADDVLTCYLTDKRLLVRFEFGVDEGNDFINILSCLKLTLFVDAVLNEDTFQRVIEELFL